MVYFWGHKQEIWCLCAISRNILASGSEDKTQRQTKTRNIDDRSIMLTLSGHRNAISALCNVNIGELVSGSEDKSLIIWSNSTPESSIYSLIQMLTTHKSYY